MAHTRDATQQTKTVYSEHQIRTWLAWIARNMLAHDQTLFQIENLQPSWLPSRLSQIGYLVRTRLLGGICIGIVIALIIAPLEGAYDWYSDGGTFDLGFWDSVSYSLFEGMILSVIIGFSLGFGVLCADILLLKETNTAGARSVPIVLTYMLTVGAACFVFMYLLPTQDLSVLSQFVYDRSYTADYSLINQYFLARVGLDDSAFAFPLIVGALFGVVVGGAVGRKRRKGALAGDIATIDLLTWSWVHAGYGVLFGLLVGGTIDALNGRLLFSPAMALLGFYGGLRPGIVSMKTRPNQGIILSMRNLFYILSGTLVLTLVLAGYFWYMIDQAASDGALQLNRPRNMAVHSALIFLYCLLFAIFFGYGLQDVLQHYLLRRTLYKRGLLPYNLSPFLDHAATELDFLQKVGGGYQFFHRYLLEYFAELKERPEQESP